MLCLFAELLKAASGDVRHQDFVAENNLLMTSKTTHNLAVQSRPWEALCRNTGRNAILQTIADTWLFDPGNFVVRKMSNPIFPWCKALIPQ